MKLLYPIAVLWSIYMIPGISGVNDPANILKQEETIENERPHLLGSTVNYMRDVIKPNRINITKNRDSKLNSPLPENKRSTKKPSYIHQYGKFLGSEIQPINAKRGTPSEYPIDRGTKESNDDDAKSDIMCILPNRGNILGCAEKFKRRSGLSTLDAGEKLSNDTSGTKETIRVSSSNLIFDVSEYRTEDDSKLYESAGLSVKLGSEACSCYWTPERCGCNCEGSLNYDDFQELSQNFFPCNKFTFSMSNGQHYALPPNFFSNVNSVDEFNLFITNATFEYVCDPTPQTSPFKGVVFANAAQIRLTGVSVRRGWNWKPFEQLRSSTGAQVNITLQDCKLRRLTSDFANLAGGRVDTVDIHNSDLEMVGSNAFGTFENMTHFRVPSNKMKHLRRTDFPYMLQNLEEMDLRNNALDNLDEDFFSNMPALKEILLSGNPISVLPEATFRGVISQAKLVGIPDIALTCDCRMKWLKESLLHDEVAKKNMNGAVCKRPSHLRGVPFTYLSGEHLRCF